MRTQSNRYPSDQSVRHAHLLLWCTLGLALALLVTLAASAQGLRPAAAPAAEQPAGAEASQAVAGDYTFVPQGIGEVTILRFTGEPTPTPAPSATATHTPTSTPTVAFDCSAVSQIPLAECQALVALYNNTNGAGWRIQWLANNMPCTWYGVTCVSGYVTSLDLSSNQLSGSIPSELGALANLRVLHLRENLLTGDIPPELGNLASLQVLDLCGCLQGNKNNLSGSIPPELGNLANLQGLYLQGNQLSGSIPPELGNLSSLQDLALGNNQLTGGIPPELGNLANLQFLDLSGIVGNRLTGSIPHELGNLANLRDLSLGGFYGGNELSGSVPSELGNLVNLQYLDLEHNPLSGALPQNLTNLHLGEFYFEETGLCEPGDMAFQAWLTGIPYVRRTNIVCAGGSPTVTATATRTPTASATPTPTPTSTPTVAFDCSAVSQIPFVECQALVALYTSTNGAGWRIQWLANNTPCTWYGVTCAAGHVTGLGMHSNDLDGSLPPELGNLSNLQSLSLTVEPSCGNCYQLGGSIPPELGNLANLQHLNLSGNYLTGAIPPQLGNLANLQYLNLIYTALSGALPMSLMNLHLAQFYFYATDLCEPGDPAFQAWLASIPSLGRNGVICAAAPVSSIWFPVTLGLYTNHGNYVTGNVNLTLNCKYKVTGEGSYRRDCDNTSSSTPKINVADGVVKETVYEYPHDVAVPANSSASLSRVNGWFFGCDLKSGESWSRTVPISSQNVTETYDFDCSKAWSWIDVAWQPAGGGTSHSMTGTLLSWNQGTTTITPSYPGGYETQGGTVWAGETFLTMSGTWTLKATLPTDKFSVGCWDAMSKQEDAPFLTSPDWLQHYFKKFTFYRSSDLSCADEPPATP